MPAQTPTERAARALISPFESFFRQETSGSILLLLCTALALVWANSAAGDTYHHLWETEIAVKLGSFELSYSLHHWINDGLMAVFFFVIGLEIKREVLVGELASLRQAALPLAAAVGGMVVPALLYAAFNAGTPEIRGWGIPMATDIAFALGVLALLGPGVPNGLKVFLAALAIVDDLGAVLVIAIFYTSDLSLAALAAGGGFLALMVAANRAGVRYPVVYAVLGAGLWLAVLKSGVHATVAGVLGAMAIPARRRLDQAGFAEKARNLLTHFEAQIVDDRDHFTGSQSNIVESLEHVCEAVETPLARLEHRLLPWVTFLVMPVFALANAGVVLGDISAIVDPVALGIAVGLVFGKQAGVLLFSVLVVRLGFASLPRGATWRQLYGVACLCGIGFTMSLFISNLAFAEPASLEIAKTGVLVASLVSGLWGWLLLRNTTTAPA